VNETVRVTVLLAAAALSLCWASLKGGPRRDRIFAIASLVWAWLVLSEVAMLRTRPADDALIGEFALSARGEVLTWLVLAASVAVMSIRWPTALRSLWRPPVAWMTCFAALAAISCAWSDSPFYSAVWAGKLVLTVLALGMLAEAVAPTHEELLPLLKIVWATFLIATILPFILAFLDPTATTFWADAGGSRYGSISTSESGAIALVLSLTVADATGRRSLAFAAAVCFLLMLVGIGKTAILAGVVSVLIYTVLARGTRAIVPICIYSISAVAIGAFALAANPDLVAHLMRYYDLNSVSTLTGRVPLWEQGIDSIREQPVLGHGYLSSRFLFTSVSAWRTALPTSLHNAALEVLYNNGVVGLLLMVGLNVSAVRRLWRGLRLRVAQDSTYRIAHATAASLYVGALINGMAGVYFGGTPHKSFILFLTTVTVVHILTAREHPHAIESPVAPAPRTAKMRPLYGRRDVDTEAELSA
jgi:O-antigen ligase